MSAADKTLLAALDQLPEKPDDSAKATKKKEYSEQMSHAVAGALGQSLRNLGCTDALPFRSGTVTKGGERRMAGGIGAKKVDVSWATEESGLLLGMSVKTINFRDARSGNFQKNLINRRGDMLIEAVTLHRRFPYAVLGGLLLLDSGAETDDSPRRRSTFENAQPRLRLFSGRRDPNGREEQFEGLFIGLVDASPRGSTLRIFEAGEPTNTVSLEAVLSRLLSLVVERNFDFYELNSNGSLTKTN